VLLLAFKLSKTTFTVYGGEIFCGREEKIHPEGYTLSLQVKAFCPAQALCKK